MLSYDNFPPIDNLIKVLKHTPHAALLYIQIHHEKDHKHHLTVSKEDVRNHFSITPTLFKNHCLSISEEGFLYFTETNKYFTLDSIK